jgi:aldehyde dehydrogenase (NAD+)
VLQEMGHPGVFSMLLPENNQIAQRFVEDERVALMSFTGSSKVGHYISETVAKRMGKSILECSGNNAIIVDETADLELAVPAIVFGAVGTAGQRCTTTRRLFIHDSIYDDLVKRLLHAYKQISIGDPLKISTLMGPLIDEMAVNGFKQAIEQAQQQGGRILYGGNVLPMDGFYVEPTLIAMEQQNPIVKDETFAPILYLLRYSKLEDAIEMHNDVPQGLSSAIFTNHIQHAEQFLSSVGSDCGIANVNIGTSGAEIGGAFGGEKQTGGGREAGSDSWKAYMRRQTNTINWGTELPLAQGIEFNVRS